MEIAKAKVANALTSAASDHVIAVAADVYDEEMGKYQSELNKENAESSGSGVEIVDSFDALRQDAPQGSLAVVASTKEVGEKYILRDSHYTSADPVIIKELKLSVPTAPLVSNIEENIIVIAPKGHEDFSGALSSGQPFVGVLYMFDQDSQTCTVIGITGDEQEFMLMEGNVVNQENLNAFNSYIAGIDNAVFYGTFEWIDDTTAIWVEPTAEQYADLDVLFGYDTTETISSTELYIKKANGWEVFKSGSTLELVNNVEDGGYDKALSAEMGKFLNEKIANIVAGNTTEPIKFKGYVNVNSTSGVDAIFDQLSIDEACLVAPSTGSSYVSWVDTALNNTTIKLTSSLLKVDYDAISILAGNGVAKTYFKLDENNPYCTCPDMLLLAKVEVSVKEFASMMDLGIAASLIPSSLKMTACIGKVLRWSTGDWLSNNQDKFALTHKYGYNTDMDTAVDTGIIGYTSVCTRGLPSAIAENYTVVIQASIDADPNYRTIQQVAYGRTGLAANRVWTRIIFKHVSSASMDDYKPWVEITKNTDILPNVNGWLYNPDNALTTGVYQTCDASKVGGLLSNNYFTLFVNASTTPNGDGYDAIEQTAYGRAADDGKILKRIIFKNSSKNVTEYGKWILVNHL